MSSISIHEARSEADLEGARTVFRAYADWIAQELGYPLDLQGFTEEFATLPGRYAPPGGDILVASDGGEVIGAIAYYRFDDSHAELKRFYMLPGAKGKGIGAALFRAALMHAKARGYRFVRLDTLKRMENARRIYAHYAFYEVPAWNHNHTHADDLLYLELDTEDL